MSIDKRNKRRTSTRSTSRVRPSGSPTIWDRIEAIGRTITPEDLKNFPPGGARDLHQYLNGKRHQARS